MAFVSSEEDVAAKILPSIPFNLLCPTILCTPDYVYAFGGYEINKNGAKKISRLVLKYAISKAKWGRIQQLPISLVNTTSILSSSKQQIYLFGGVSDQVDLTGPELNFFVYNIPHNHWVFKVDLSVKSPFVNSRYIKPLVTCVGNDLFLSYQKDKSSLSFKLFELQRGGINLKYHYDEVDPNQMAKVLKKQQSQVDLSAPSIDYERRRQGELSLLMVKNQITVIDEITKSLIKITIEDQTNIAVEKIECPIENQIQVRRNAQEDPEEANTSKQINEKADL